MNVSEVDMLSNNLREFYRASAYPSLNIQTGGQVWYLVDNEIMSYSHSLTPHESSESLFKWVFR